MYIYISYLRSFKLLIASSTIAWLAIGIGARG